MVLPLTFKVEEYGNIISKEVTQDYIKFIIESHNKATIYMIEERLDGPFTIHNVKILGQTDLEWTDKLSSGGIFFIREIGHATLYIRDGSVIFKKKVLPVKPFKKK